MSAALKLYQDDAKLSRKPPLGEKRPRLRLVWENPELSHGTQKEKPEVKPEPSYGRVLYNYYRYYDPNTGRYITSDPIGLDGGLNTYLYANANPIRYIDPEGLNPGLARVALAAALAAAKALKNQIIRGAKWCKSWRCKIEVHNAHHYFPALGKKECHVQLTCWRKGAKGSTKIWRWPFSCDKKGPPFVPDRRGMK